MYVLLIVVCPFVLFLLAIVLSVLLGYTDSDYLPFGIFKLFTLTFACMLVLTMCFMCFSFVTMLLMSVLKAHKSLCYYAIFIHVPTINKVMNLNLKATALSHVII